MISPAGALKPWQGTPEGDEVLARVLDPSDPTGKPTSKPIVLERTKTVKHHTEIAKDLHRIALYVERLSRLLSDPAYAGELMSHANDALRALIDKFHQQQAQIAQLQSQQTASNDLTVDANTLAEADALLAAPAAAGTGTDTMGGTAQPTPTPATPGTGTDTTGGAAQPAPVTPAAPTPVPPGMVVDPATGQLVPAPAAPAPTPTP